MDNRRRAHEALNPKDRIILSLAKNYDQRYTMLSLSATVGIPYATLHRTVARLKPLLRLERAGKAVLVSLDTNNHVTKHHVIVASDAERQEFLSKQPLMRAITKDLPAGDYTVVLFGSYAKGTQTARSDIDLLVVNHNGKRMPDFSHQEALFKVPINPMYVTPKELKEMLAAAEENVGKQALRNHVVLHRPDLFWTWAYG